VSENTLFVELNIFLETFSIYKLFSGLEKFEKLVEGCVCLFDNRLRSDDDLIAPPQMETTDRKVPVNKDHR
jgi:hypothetical protein